MTGWTPLGLRPPPELTGFRWVRPLGSGGFADVHLYRQEKPDRDVAVKVLREAADEQGRASMLREANAMAAVAGHPAVVSLYSVGDTDDGRPFIAMEYCPVANLGEQVRLRPMLAARALDVMVRISAGAEMLHRHGLVHRDIKPSNIMLTAWDRPVLGDFGVALPVGEVVRENTGGFSVLWAPPEQQINGTPVHPSQDVWALAATTWTLLAGRSPFEDPVGDNSMVAVAARVRAGKVPGLGRPDVPPELEETLRRALVLDPTARTPSALEFGRGLQAVQDVLHQTRTPLEVRDRPVGADPQPVDGDRTRLRAMPVLSAEKTRAVARADVPPADPEPAVPAAPDAVPVKPVTVRTGPRWWVVALLLVAAVLVTVAIVSPNLGDLLPKASPSATVQGQDPLSEPPKAPTDLAGTFANGRVSWSWKASATHKVSYQVTITRPGQTDIVRMVQTTEVDVEAVPGENCLTVTTVGADGRPSTSTPTSCVTVPS